MRLTRDIKIVNPDGASHTIPRGTKLETLGKLLQGGGLKYKIHIDETKHIPKAFWYAARGCWLCSFYAIRISPQEAERWKTEPRRPYEEVLVADGSKSINAF
jgi:hypothetical protein